MVYNHQCTNIFVLLMEIFCYNLPYIINFINLVFFLFPCFTKCRTLTAIYVQMKMKTKNSMVNDSTVRELCNFFLENPPHTIHNTVTTV